MSPACRPAHARARRFVTSPCRPAERREPAAIGRLAAGRLTIGSGEGGAAGAAGLARRAHGADGRADYPRPPGPGPCGRRPERARAVSQAAQLPAIPGAAHCLSEPNSELQDPSPITASPSRATSLGLYQAETAATALARERYTGG